MNLTQTFEWVWLHNDLNTVVIYAYASFHTILLSSTKLFTKMLAHKTLQKGQLLWPKRLRLRVESVYWTTVMSAVTQYFFYVMGYICYWSHVIIKLAEKQNFGFSNHQINKQLKYINVYLNYLSFTFWIGFLQAMSFSIIFQYSKMDRHSVFFSDHHHTAFPEFWHLSHKDQDWA